MMPPSPLTLALMVVGVGIVLCGAAVGMMAWSLVHPPRMTDGKAMWVLRRLSPADLGLPFEEVALDIRDEQGRAMRIVAWWIPNPAAGARCAVLVHGYGDAKFGAIAWAPTWHRLGFHLLVPDLRGHGESGGSLFTAGYFERHDLSQVIDQWMARKPEQMRQVVLFGISAGCATAAATAVDRTDITAVVMDSPYADFRRAAMAQMDWLGAPGRLLQRPAIALAEWVSGANYDQVAPAALIPQLRCPVLVIQSAGDSIITADHRAALSTSAGGMTEVWTVQNAAHLTAIHADPLQYEQHIAQFLAKMSPRELAQPTGRQ